MILDFNPATRAFILRVQRVEGIQPRTLMDEHGLDFSTTASTANEFVLFTKEPYAAVAFWNHATPAAQRELLDLQNRIDESWRKESDGHIKVPEGKELFGFQKAGVEYALRRGNALIGDQPGLGKTMQAIAFANEINAKRVLVIVPANLRLQWCKKIREWSTMEWPYIVYPVLHGKYGVHPTANWTIVSYDLCRSPAIRKALAKGLYDLVITDEGHYLKTSDSGRAKAVLGGLHRDADDPPPLVDRCGAHISLTGTPLPGRPREAFTLAKGLCYDSIDFMSENAFQERFNPRVKRETAEGKVYMDERTGRHGELQARLRSNFMVRRLKREVLPQLKVPIFDIVHVEETALVRQALQAESLLDIDPENLEGADAETLGQIATVRRLMGVALAPQAAEYVEMLLDGGEERCLVFAWHTEVLDILQKALGKYGLLRIDGKTSAAEKQRIVEEFQSNPKMRIVAGNMSSMGTGTDGLQQVCQRAVFAESDWTPGNNTQAVDRLDRMGQDSQVFADFLVAPGSFSEKVLASALRKNVVTHQALDRIM